ncbi:MAG: hypothetical protein FWH38_08090 [Treponema sp.]|nr:hypothetical protein [Treponema sp.]
MKKLVIVLALAAVLATGTAFADFDILSYPGSLEGGNLLIDIGLGLNSYGLLYGGSLKIPPAILTVNYCLPVSVPISVGGFFSLSQYGSEWSGGYKYRRTYFIIGAQADWHWGFDMTWLDLYTGLSTGYCGTVYNYDGPDNAHKTDFASRGYLDYGFHGGAHFYFSKNIGVVVEAGYPTWLKVGLALKF